jgi:hypothetical protein
MKIQFKIITIFFIIINLNIWAESKIWVEYKSKNGVGAMLPNFSYAGVNNSVRPIITPNYKVFNVIDFGATPNDNKSDKHAIIKAIKKAEKNGSGIIYFPKGRYRINEDCDFRKSILIKSSNIILKGEGSDEGGTEIFMKNHMVPVNQSDKIKGKYGNKRMYHAKSIFMVKNKPYKKLITKVVKNAPKGAKILTVKNSSKLKKGQWICLKLENKDTEIIKQGIYPLELEREWKQITDIGLLMKSVHRIKSIKASQVELYEPICFNLKEGWNYCIFDYKPLERIGVEGIKFSGDFQRKFKHHGSAIDDGGWKFWEMQGVVNSWVRDCKFSNCTGSVRFVNSAYCSALNMKIEGFGGHYAVNCSGSTGILIAKVIDSASSWHAVGVAKPGVGNVIWRCRYNENRCFESHATQPRATLFDCVEGGFSKGFAGGASTSCPNHLQDLVLWNYKEIGKPETDFSFFSRSSKFWKFYPPIVVGFHGTTTTFDTKDLQYIESLGRPVEPESLFEQQLTLRLGYLPEWLTRD